MPSISASGDLRSLGAEVRQLRCLLRITRLLNEQDVPSEALFQDIVELIPSAYQYPELACARIRCDDRAWATPGFLETPWEQTTTISTNTASFGSIQVCYRKEMPEEAEGPFLEGERELVDAIGDLLAERIERLRMSEALWHNEERLQTLLDTAPITLWAVDREETITILRGRLLSKLGLDPAEYIGKPMQSLIARRQDLQDCLEKALAGERPVAEIKWRASILECRFFPITGRDGTIEGAFGILRDMTTRILAERALHRSNALLEELFSSTSFLIAYLDRELKYIRVNEAYARARGRKADSFAGLSYLDLPHDPKNVAVFMRVLETREPFMERDKPMPFLSPPGRELTFWDLDVLPLGRPDDPAEGLLLILVNRTRGVKVLTELEKSRQELKRLTSHLQDLRETERKGIAREIHDGLGGLLTALRLDIALLGKQPPPGCPDPDALKRADELATRAIAMVRKIASDLRPNVLDDLGLLPAIEWLVGEFRKRAKIRCVLSLPETDIHVDKNVETALFRVLEETLTNVARHSRATRVSIDLRAAGGSLELTVSDNGRGITEAEAADSSSFGLIGIRERAGHFGGTVVIRGAPNKGTTVGVAVPLGKIEETADAARRSL